jgi:integrase
MSTTHASTKEVRHSKDDALDTREFEQLLEATYDLQDYYGLQSRFVILVAGRLGMRAGEIAHMKESWVDWRRSLIDIPRHQPCDDGRNGGLCGYCKRKARQKTNHGDEPTLADAKRTMWSPKTKAAAREIPLDAAPRAEIVLSNSLTASGSGPTRASQSTAAWTGPPKPPRGSAPATCIPMRFGPRRPVGSAPTGSTCSR